MNANFKDLTGIKKNRWTFIKFHCFEKTPSGSNTTNGGVSAIVLII